MTVAFELSRDRTPRRSLDLGLLPVVDRACLRLLGRCEAATPEQLARLV